MAAVARLDITTDNAAVCTTAGGTYDAGTDTCSVDITSDNAGVAAVAEQTGCEAANGTWDGSSCTPAAAPYNCFLGGFCSQAGILFVPAGIDFGNVYDGHTMTTEPALGAGCNGSDTWDNGEDFANLVFDRGDLGLFPVLSVCE